VISEGLLQLRMSLTVQQLLADAKRLSGRLREHDQSADQLITRAQEVLKEVDAMKQYQEDVENLNEVAHNRPRAQLVLGIQQENRHIRALQQENKELRAALEEHQNALELIMSKYRQHVTRLINSTRIDKNLINNHKTKLLQARTDKVCEMAAVMKESVKLDEAASNQQQELLSRLITENKGLRELLDISRKNGSLARGRGLPKPSQDKEVQTEEELDAITVVTLPCPVPPRHAPTTPTCVPPLVSHMECSPEPPDTDGSCRDHSSASESDETSDDDSVKYDTIKLANRRRTVVPTTLKEEEEEEVDKERLKEEEVGKERLKVEEEASKERLKVDEEVIKDRLKDTKSPDRIEDGVKDYQEFIKKENAVKDRLEPVNNDVKAGTKEVEPLNNDVKAGPDIIKKNEAVEDRLAVKEETLVNHSDEVVNKAKEEPVMNHSKDDEKKEPVVNHLEDRAKTEDNEKKETVVNHVDDRAKEEQIVNHEKDKVKEEPIVNHAEEKVKEEQIVNHSEVIAKESAIPTENHQNPVAHLENSIDSIEKTLESFEKTIDCLENSSEDLVDTSRVESCNTATATIETTVDKVNEDLIGCEQSEQNHKPAAIQNDNKENIKV